MRYRPSTRILLAVFPLPLIAQEQARDTARANPVIITATRVPLSQGSLPVAVTVITGGELRARGITTVSDALTNVTSAYVAQTGSQGAQTSLFLRGGESKYAKVLIDGVPVNDPGGAYDFGSLTTDNVDRIEIVRGPASVIHGADAVTGVVHIITHRGEGAPRLEVDLQGGAAPRDAVRGDVAQPDAMQTRDGSALMSGGLSSGSYSLSIARHQSTGLYELNNDYFNNVVTGRFDFSPSAGTDLRASLHYNDYRFHYPTSGAGTPDSIGAFNRNAYRSEDRTAMGIEVGRRLSSSLKGVLTLNSNLNDGGTDDRADRPTGNTYISQDATRRRGAELRVHYVGRSAVGATVGVQTEQQDQRSQSEGAFGGFAFNTQFTAARRNTGGYAEVVLTPSTQLTATIGARQDKNERFGDFTTGRAGLSWRPFGDTRLRATAGSAFREPTFYENYATGYVKGNPQLQPERARSFDVGIEQELLTGAARVSVTGFAQRFANMIDYTGDTTGCGYSYCNIAASRANGIEIEGEGRLVRGLTLLVSATYLDTRVLSPGYDTSRAGVYRRDESLIRRPNNTWNAVLSYRGDGRLSASARFLRVGPRTDRDFRPYPAKPVTLDLYQRMDVGAEYAVDSTPPRRTSLQLRVENLQNTGYQNVFNFFAPRRTISFGVRTIL